jgi:carboxyl-terminal processing protease
MNDQPPRSRTFPFVFVALAAFAGGVLLDRAGWVPGGGGAPFGIGRTFRPFWQAWRLVKEYYVDPQSAQDETMTRGAIAGMLDSLGDVGHTSYLTPDEVRRLEDSLSGKLEGIGARITVRNRQPVILQTLPRSPARKAGLKAGDILLDVEGEPVAAMSLQKLVDRVRGPAGSVVHLRIQRPGESAPRVVAITRARVDVPEVTWHLLPGAPIAHVAIREFGKKADEQLRAALAGSRQKGARALIVDVRGNPGGLKEQAVAVTSEFLQKGQVVFIEQDARGRQKKVLARGDGKAATLPVCVLIDGGTASSGEIFAGALQDHRRARLVGTRTFGTGTVLRQFDLSDGSAVLLAVAKWLTPKGHEIWHKGITPDVGVKLPEDATILLPESEEDLTEAGLRASKDAQLLKALDLLRQELQKEPS